MRQSKLSEGGYINNNSNNNISHRQSLCHHPSLRLSGKWFTQTQTNRFYVCGISIVLKCALKEYKCLILRLKCLITTYWSTRHGERAAYSPPGGSVALWRQRISVLLTTSTEFLTLSVRENLEIRDEALKHLPVNLWPQTQYSWRINFQSVHTAAWVCWQDGLLLLLIP